MSPAVRRSKALPLAILATGAALTLSGCIMPPPLPTAAPTPSSQPTTPPQPTTSAAPVETPSAPTPQPSSGGELPELVAINTPLPAGTLPGWETSILTDGDTFTIEADNTFPAGPTISVTEVATGCTIWAYQGVEEHDSGDEAENSEFVLGLLSESSPDDWEPDVFTLAPSSQGVAVEMLSIIRDADDGGIGAWYARNFQSSGSTSSIAAVCPAGAGDIEHIDAIIGEHFQINFLQP